MFCEHCGSYLEEGAKFCTNCGTPVATLEPEPCPAPEPAPVEEPRWEEPAAPLYQQPAAPAYQQPAPVYRQPEPDPLVNEERNSLAKASLIFGIIGLSFTCTVWLSLLGIIFSAIGRGKIKAYLAAGGKLSGKAKVGSVLSKLGLVFGIILFVCVVIWLIMIIALAVMDGDLDGYFRYL